ncbi:alkaline phosphatase D family protein [Nocardioides carbamazepini]|uniref:alkaline phosphatase D family protein n=1 Tax=Nocardioides carbamazepini TaxID=2854259 RepID=UPI00214A6A6C|nr:alkaline phosphatase D family protein [Nocardioides carbamazepini]MCR1786341.1 alkaline phosphatase D family protein [Nocardioides carbamazepini]
MSDPSLPVSGPRGLSRRVVMAGALGGGAALALASWPEAVAASAPFVHGVASGDPLPGGVVLWTRVTPSVEAAPGSGVGPDVVVTWEVALDPGFAQVVQQGTATASAARDHTLHVDVGGLAPATAYWYRFTALGATSRTGRTRTAPAAGSSAPVRFGVVSCANYDWGYFQPYEFLATRTDLHAILHLGDYVYEYAPGGVIAGYPKNPRNADPLHECTTLDDYRVRHGCYKLEQNLQDLHAAHPMVAVWDDHEIANDTWRDGAENHDPAAEGDWATRATAGRRAFLEWLPIRHTDPDDWQRINRRLVFGSQVDLWMLDERRFRTRPPKSVLLGYVALGASSGDPDGSMIGDDQEHWLVQGLAASTARWKVLGNQVPFFPQVLLPQLPGQITDLLGPKLSQQLEKPLLQLYVEDWNGFLAQRQRLVDGMAGIDDVVILTGDVHQSFASEIPARPNRYLLDRRSVAVEYVTPGVASPSLQTMVNQVAPGVGNLLDVVLTTNNALANPWIRWSEGFKTGCMIVDFSSARVQADWYLVDKGTDPSSPIRRVASRQTKAGTRRITAATQALT